MFRSCENFDTQGADSLPHAHGHVCNKMEEEEELG